MENILLVEDDFALRIQMQFSLEEKYTVFEAGNVEEALDLLQEKRIHIIILDLGLPPHENTPDEGIRLLKFVQNNYSAKIIILTGQKTEDAALQAIKSGAFDYIVKPINFDYLEAGILAKHMMQRRKGGKDEKV
jgi:two-component system, response regulator RegA